MQARSACRLSIEATHSMRADSNSMMSRPMTTIERAGCGWKCAVPLDAAQGASERESAFDLGQAALRRETRLICLLSPQLPRTTKKNVFLAGRGGGAGPAGAAGAAGRGPGGAGGPGGRARDG